MDCREVSKLLKIRNRGRTNNKVQEKRGQQNQRETPKSQQKPASGNSRDEYSSSAPTRKAWESALHASLTPSVFGIVHTTLQILTGTTHTAIEDTACCTVQFWRLRDGESRQTDRERKYEKKIAFEREKETRRAATQKTHSRPLPVSFFLATTSHSSSLGIPTFLLRNGHHDHGYEGFGGIYPV